MKFLVIHNGSNTKNHLSFFLSILDYLDFKISSTWLFINSVNLKKKEKKILQEKKNLISIKKKQCKYIALYIKHFPPNGLIHFNRVLLMKLQIFLCNDSVKLANYLFSICHGVILISLRPPGAY